MKKFLSWIKNKASAPGQDEFLEMEEMRPAAKVTVKTYQLESFEDAKRVISDLRVGNIIGLVDMKPLREKDVIDLKRSIIKLKNVCAEFGADIASLGGDWIVIAPGFAEIYKPKANAPEVIDMPPPPENFY
ncbi:MAG: cell division protein SepF [Nanoarchaeota archaeon]|nr:cell division protein SepF [Nanoarchaeota archaeon]MBU4352390.1 cell division protein SepF [Nanoarchaeota archaeon]MBU4456230.1 cell division protein SepF [Nanoarchaeota archaeon]